MGVQIVQGLLQVVIFGLGAALIVWAMASAIRNFVLPRSAPDRLGRIVFVAMRRLFDLRNRSAQTYEARDRVMAFYAPLSLLMLTISWLALVLLGYMGMFWAVGVPTWEAAFLSSGSALFTLGFAPVAGLAQIVLAFTEATLGLILIALLIAYLPTMYSAFSRREAAVTMLEVRAGSPPSVIEMLARFNRIHGLAALHDLWVAWEAWFVDVEETHTSLSALTFFRSPAPERSWITAAGAVLDAAAFTAAALDVPRDPQRDLTLRAGYLALRHIADFFAIPYNTHPVLGDPISITRQEFDAACDDLAQQGVPLKPDRDQAWRDFCGWRVNYDTVLLALCALIMAPYAPWSSDRGLRVRVTVLGRLGR